MLDKWIALGLEDEDTCPCYAQNMGSGAFLEQFGSSQSPTHTRNPEHSELYDAELFCNKGPPLSLEFKMNSGDLNTRVITLERF